jgi:flagellar hook-length control protein FliK
MVDPANPFAGLLLQAPAQASDAVVKAAATDNNSQSGDSADTGRFNRSAVTGTDVGSKKQMESGRQLEDFSSPVTQTVAQVAMLANSVKHMANAADHTIRPLTVQNNSMAIVTGASSGSVPGMPAGGTPAHAPQIIATPLGNSAWANEFSQKIVWISTQQNHSAELHLNPPDLGQLNVVLKISDNQLTAQFTSPHIAVREALENALPKLREVLADNNIMLGNTTISDQPPRERGEGSMNHGSGSSAQHGAPYGSGDSIVTSPAAAVVVPVRRHIGMLDTFA